MIPPTGDDKEVRSKLQDRSNQNTDSEQGKVVKALSEQVLTMVKADLLV